MGCDIHVMTERLQTINGVQGWWSVDHYKYEPYTGDLCQVELYGDRSYTLFAILAGVRNYGGNVPMSEPRGIPDDASFRTLKEYDSWQGDAHSASWFTLAELMAAREKYRVAQYRGFVPLDQVAAAERGEMPEEYCQGVSHPEKYKWMTWSCETDNLGVLVEALIDRMCEEMYVRRGWSNFNKVLEREAGRFRIIFWFDN